MGKRTDPATAEGPVSLGKAVRSVLNRGGYAFHQRVIREAEAAFNDAKEKGETRWRFETVEFPVQVKNRDTRIDILLRYYQRAQYLCVECKRADPALANWVFLRLPVLARDRPDYERFHADCVQLLQRRQTADVGPRLQLDPLYGRTITDRAADLALVTKADAKGDGTGTHDDIERATTQAHIAANGLLERWLGVAADELPERVPHSAIPAIFTTAKLHLGEIDVSKVTDLQSGKLTIAEVPLSEVPWVYLQSPVSIGIRAKGAPQSYSSDIALALDREMIRTVPIVSAGAIREFLQTFDPALDERMPTERGLPFSRSLTRM